LEEFSVLSMQGLTDKSLLAILSLPQLKALKIHTSHITSSGVRRAFRQKASSNLKSLDLTFMTKLTDRLLLYILRATPEVKSLYIFGCQKISNVGIAGISKYCSQLEIVDLYNLSHITTVAVEILVDSLPMLSSLFVGECANVTCAGMEGLRDTNRNISIRFHNVEGINIWG
jgi:hypothetical protein